MELYQIIHQLMIPPLLKIIYKLNHLFIFRETVKYSDNVVIGSNCKIGPNVVINKNVVIIYSNSNFKIV